MKYEWWRSSSQRDFVAAKAASRYWVGCCYYLSPQAHIHDYYKRVSVCIKITYLLQVFTLYGIDNYCTIIKACRLVYIVIYKLFKQWTLWHRYILLFPAQLQMAGMDILSISMTRPLDRVTAKVCLPDGWSMEKSRYMNCRLIISVDSTQKRHTNSKG